MENENKGNNPSFIERILDHKVMILIIGGFLIRFVMLAFYYITHIIDPLKSWGDVGINFQGSYHYPPLTMYLLYFFRIISFESVEVFAFWAFFLEIVTVLIFFFVLKSFKMTNLKYAYGLFLINPFFFLNNVFSLENCGYHITDSFFFIFLFLALYFYPREEIWSRYLFYVFLAFSAVAKIYTLPIMGFFFLKFIVEKDWEELKKFLIGTVPIVLIFLVVPIFYIENYISLYLLWNEVGEDILPLYIRVIIIAIICIPYIFLRIKKAGLLEITFFSIIIVAIFLFFSKPFIRYFQPILIYGILTPYTFFTFTLNLRFIKREINFNNQLLVFYSSFIFVGVAYLIIIFLL